MITTATYLLVAKIDGEEYHFHYEHCYDSWAALEQFWHEDYPEVLIDKGGVFPITILSMLEGKVMFRYAVTFNCGVFHAFFDHGHTASGIYTLDQFAKDIDAKEQEPETPGDIIDRWSSFCYNHPPYDEVILWMVGGSRQHYLYQHFCSKWLHHCDRCQQDTAAAWFWFYRELDSEWRDRLIAYIYSEWKKNK